jgi:hypothetical protein
LQRNSAAELFEELLDAGDCGFHFEDVLRRLDEEEVDASFYKVLGLVVEILRELVEGDVAECGVGARGSMPVGPIDAATNFGLSGVLIFVGGCASDASGCDVDVADFVAESPFGQLRGVLWKVQVSTTSTPTSRNDSWIA